MSIFDDIFGSGDTTIETESSSEPWKYTKDILRHIQRRVEHDLVGTPMMPFPGMLQAPMTPYEMMAMQSFGGLPGQYGDLANMYMNAAQQGLGFALNAPDIANNPVYQEMAGAIRGEVNRNLTENLLPQIRATDIAGGGFSSRGALAEGEAVAGTSEALSDALARMGAQAYGQGLQAQSAALGMMPGIAGQYANLLGMGPQALMQAGMLERAQAERELGQEQYLHEFGQMEPWRRYQMALGLTMPMATAFGEGMGRQMSATDPSIMQMIGGGLGLAGMGAGLFGGMGGFGGMPGMGGGLGPGSNYGYRGIPILPGTPSYYGMDPRMSFGV